MERIYSPDHYEKLEKAKLEELAKIRAAKREAKKREAADKKRKDAAATQEQAMRLALFMCDSDVLVGTGESARRMRLIDYVDRYAFIPSGSPEGGRRTFAEWVEANDLKALGGTPEFETRGLNALNGGIDSGGKASAE